MRTCINIWKNRSSTVGYVYIDIIIRGKREKKVKALVDTSASYVILNSQTIKELELSPTPYEVMLTLADKRRVKARLYAVSYTHLTLPTICSV